MLCKTIEDGSISAREAANIFAETYCDDGRKVGKVIAAPDAALKFQFVDGVQWYAVRILPDHLAGWQITREGI